MEKNNWENGQDNFY